MLVLGPRWPSLLGFGAGRAAVDGELALLPTPRPCICLARKPHKACLFGPCLQKPSLEKHLPLLPSQLLPREEPKD